ncbi:MULTISPECIES: UvrD-helicase domain-containing protein [Cyanophyceae]|uniref:UvrD-helicase domain-containing protein n=1 Tax=Cyanophyceae TaxID=3028117 RepID=UPI0016828BFE|nr:MULTISPECIES: UvrD-helicase domain-containing protein [Cyanophyceae]MBD1916266.1 UvrD-helicase domain-containing protein [Phormidium sp. FACHB-77]MBD2028392.1 UvrD-helicase domain-containing protein [Phormidium sp. FACHB-322]MBD2051871.1 UvrD-helicase domain-containing protein [Leptolyngbya sp. FACHB-60]
MGLTEQQERAAYSPQSVAVMAGAGTGKTHMLSERYRYFLQQGFSPLQIVAVTFTEKAAAELRSRIRSTIATSMGDRPDLLAELEAAQISTFHALAARICREHSTIANVPPDFAVQDELESPIWQADVFADALAQLPSYFYLGLPYSLMRDVLQALLADPLTAAQALEKGRNDWLPWVERIQRQALEEFLSHPDWLSSKHTLQAYAAPGDKLEEHRLAALGAIALFEEGHAAQALDILDSLRINVGSQKNWGGKDVLDAVKGAIAALRDLAREAIKTGLITLEPNACDDQTDALLPNLRGAFVWVRDFLQKAKYQQRVLDFNDLEIHALQALADPAVQHYYAQRWQVFLIDEFQDTNPIQGQLLETLTANATLTIVGDPKQSIYSFRQADVRVFEAWQSRIHPSNDSVELSLSFRTHQALITQINQVFAPVLAELHQPLDAHRQETLEPNPEIQLFTVTVDEEYQKDKGIDTNADACRRVEAQKIADLVEDMLSAKLQVHDKPSGQLRDIQPKDIAILSRTWGPLELYGNAIAARDTPVLQAGGGNLLDTREAKDAGALLRFLADPTDSLALAVVLRSPFFAVSDTILYTFAQTLPKKTGWWKHLRDSADPDLSRARETLGELLIARRTEAPTRLLQIGDRLTGYTAVIANLPGADRRLADWQGFGELVRSLESDSFDALAVIRRLQRLQTAEVEVPRPALAGGNAVSLMTIHGSKGLEWPVVIVPDLARQSRPDSPLVRFDPELGVALKLEDEDSERQKSALYILLEQRKKAADSEESKRVLYVALTRVRDRLILTAAKAAGGGLDILQPGLEGLITPASIPFAPALAQPVAPVAPIIPPLPEQIMLYPARAGFAELPVTALSDYAICPLRFKFRHVDGHPGYTSGNGTPNMGMELGKLTHKALELGINQAEPLATYAPHLPSTAVAEALSLAQAFRQLPVYAAYRAGATHWEHPVSLTLGDLTLNGVVDLVGEDFVLDFKTDQTMHPEHHQFQLWAYSQAIDKPNAHLAYLRHNHIYTFDSAALNNLKSQASVLAKKLVKGDFIPKPSKISCGICPYVGICESDWSLADM